VVYSDTDSLFFNSKVTDLAEALNISDRFKKAVNDRYKLLEIDLDPIFQRLLLQKKKYAAIKIRTDSHTSIEIKGLDTKRREYCALSKSASQYVMSAWSNNLFWWVLCRYVLEKILSGEATENVVELIHEYLATIGENVRGGKIKIDEFIIFRVGSCL
jgi:DNA polymerase alpha subunit A